MLAKRIVVPLAVLTLGSAQAGTEVFTGSGRLDTTAYSVKTG